MTKIISWNVNGLRASERYGFIKKALRFKADFICLQEIKADPEKLSEEVRNLPGYKIYINNAQKPGYSGVAVYVKQIPLRVITKIGESRFDSEGRMLCLEYDKFLLLNLYLPHGGREKQNLEYKLQCYKKLFQFLKKFNKPIILAGDFNIAHEEIDLARPSQNLDNIMFTPKERKQIDFLINLGFIDSFREFNKENGNYTWWSYRKSAREQNIGWRIDYIFVPEVLKKDLKSAEILKEISGSDHCPISAKISI